MPDTQETFKYREQYNTLASGILLKEIRVSIILVVVAVVVVEICKMKVSNKQLQYLLWCLCG